MATGINDHLYYNETDECGICSELLVDPRGLPCRPHTFCFKCLTYLIEHARSFLIFFLYSELVCSVLLRKTFSGNLSAISSLESELSEMGYFR
jgi:hypothetical protein